jgi:hypothetical protein
MMEINWLAIIVCGVVAMIVGMIWHNPKVFGNTYMKALGADMNISPEKMKVIQQKMWQLYVTQFILVLFEVWILAQFIINHADSMSNISVALWIWAGFVLPTVAISAIWSTRPRKYAWQIFLISASYNLVLFILFAIIIKAMM